MGQEDSGECVCKFKLYMNLEINYGYTNASMMERYFKTMSEYCGRENMEHIVCEYAFITRTTTTS